MRIQFGMDVVYFDGLPWKMLTDAILHHDQLNVKALKELKKLNCSLMMSDVVAIARLRTLAESSSRERLCTRILWGERCAVIVPISGSDKSFFRTFCFFSH
jgi:hypothetical protein